MLEKTAGHEAVTDVRLEDTAEDDAATFLLDGLLLLHLCPTVTNGTDAKSSALNYVSFVYLASEIIPQLCTEIVKSSF